MVDTQDCYQLVIIINQLLTIIIIIIVDVMRMLSRACFDYCSWYLFLSLSKILPNRDIAFSFKQVIRLVHISYQQISYVK